MGGGGGGGGRGLSDLRMADGLMTLVDEMNLKGVSPLATVSEPLR